MPSSDAAHLSSGCLQVLLQLCSLLRVLVCQLMAGRLQAIESGLQDIERGLGLASSSRRCCVLCREAFVSRLHSPAINFSAAFGLQALDKGAGCV